GARAHEAPGPGLLIADSQAGWASVPAGGVKRLDRRPHARPRLPEPHARQRLTRSRGKLVVDTGVRYLVTARSTDGGKTWSKPERHRLWGHPYPAVRMPSARASTKPKS